MKKNAFTLIETIGVIIVVALVATVTIPIIFNTSDRNRVSEQELADVKAILDYYFEAHPDKKEELKATGTLSIQREELIGEGFIHEITTVDDVVVTINEDGSYKVTAGFK